MDGRLHGGFENLESCLFAFSFVIYYVILWGRWDLFLALDLGLLYLYLSP
jgi:hypothetical protein